MNVAVDVLAVSNEDMISLVYAVHTRIKELNDLHQRVWFAPLLFPPEITADLERMSTLMHRHAGGDYRHKESEKIAVRNVAQWTVDRKASLCNQPPKVVEWGD